MDQQNGGAPEKDRKAEGDYDVPEVTQSAQNNEDHERDGSVKVVALVFLFSLLFFDHWPLILGNTRVVVRAIFYVGESSALVVRMEIPEENSNQPFPVDRLRVLLRDGRAEFTKDGADIPRVMRKPI